MTKYEIEVTIKTVIEYMDEDNGKCAITAADVLSRLSEDLNRENTHYITPEAVRSISIEKHSGEKRE